MAYADQQGMSTGRMVSIGLVLVLHVLLGYAFVTGLAYEAVSKVKERLEAQEITEDEPPPEEEPPPEPEPIQELEPPPIETFKPPVQAPPSTNTKPKDDTPPAPKTRQCAGGIRVLAEQECPDPDPVVACPAGTEGPGGATRVKTSQLSSCKKKVVKPDLSSPAKPKNNRGRWVTTNDYPSRELSRENEGTSRITLTVGPNGKATNCTSSGATPGLNAAACKFAKRRARFHPAKNRDGNPITGTYTTSVRWQIPK